MEQTYYIVRPEGWVHEVNGVLEVVDGVLTIGDYEVPAGLVPCENKKAAYALARINAFRDLLTARADAEKARTDLARAEKRIAQHQGTLEWVDQHLV